MTIGPQAKYTDQRAPWPAKVAATFAGRQCCVVSVTDGYGRQSWVCVSIRSIPSVVEHSASTIQAIHVTNSLYVPSLLKARIN